MTKIKPPPEYNIGIIGCGKMGKDLFDFLCTFPFHITLVCKTDDTIEQTRNAFRKKQKRALKYQLIDQNTFDFRYQNTVITSDLKHLKNCNLVIETITENILKKKKLIQLLEPILSSDCILASNTSSIPLDELFTDMANEENCLGLHFFFPAGMKDIVEVNVAKSTSKKTVSFVRNFLKKIGKFNLVLTPNDHFIINRLFLKMQAGCCQLLEDGKSSVQEIDSLVKAHLFPLGVFEFFDNVGNDVMLQSVKNYMQYEENQAFYRPLIVLLEQKVREGKLGVKSKFGFYEYPLKKSEQLLVEISEVLQKITYWYLDGIFDTYEKSICTKDELEHIVKEYMMIEKSPFELAMETGYTPK